MVGVTDNNQLFKGKRSGGCCGCGGDNGGNDDNNDDGNGNCNRRRLMNAMVKVGPFWPLAREWGRVTNLKGRTNLQKGGSTFDMPSIAMVECEKTWQEVKRTTEWVFGWWKLLHIKY
jgi:hypothetical protein